MKSFISSAVITLAVSMGALQAQQQQTSPGPGQPSAEDTRFLQSKTAPQEDYLSSSQIVGASVRASGNEEIGTVSQLVFDPYGQIHFAIVTSAQWGHIPVPWGSLTRQSTTSPPANFFTVNMTADQIQKAPQFKALDAGDLKVSGTAAEVNRFWGVQDTPAPRTGEQPSVGGDSSPAARQNPDTPTTPVDPKARTTTPR